MGRTVKPTSQGGRQESNSLPRRLIQSHLLQTTLGTGAAQEGAAPRALSQTQETGTHAKLSPNLPSLHLELVTPTTSFTAIRGL